MRYSKNGMISWTSARRSDRGVGIILDRDGVINERIPDGYVLSWSDFRWRPDALAAMSMLVKAGLPLVVATNQSCVGRGLLSQAGLVAIMQRMRAELDARGIPLAGWYCCPHAPDAGCSCRKPGNAMLIAAGRDLRLDLTRSYLIGDSPSDVQAGESVGCKSFLVESGNDRSFELVARDIAARETATDPV